MNYVNHIDVSPHTDALVPPAWLLPILFPFPSFPFQFFFVKKHVFFCYVNCLHYLCIEKYFNWYLLKSYKDKAVKMK